MSRLTHPPVNGAVESRDAARHAAAPRSWFRRASYFVVDGITALILLVCRVALSTFAKHKRQLKISQRIMDGCGLDVIRHHYYTPAYFPKNIDESKLKDRKINGLELCKDKHLELLNQFSFRDELLDIYFHPGKYGFRFDNGFFESGDAEYFYNIIRSFKPERIVEVGAGNSTRIAQIALAKNRSEDPSYACHHICIEPFHHNNIEDLDVDIISKRVEECEVSDFSRLQAGDILFIDSSHVIRPQGDVLFEYLTLLGALNKHVLVHVHDIFTPRDYPPEWILEERRMWNEQYLLEAFLSFNKSFQVIGAVNWLWHSFPEKMWDACPVLYDHQPNEPGSFWFRRVE